MKGLASLFYRDRHLLALTVLVLLFAGALALRGLPRLEDPRITNRNPIVLTPVPGATAERVESLVTEVLEDALTEVDGIARVESTSRFGLSVLQVELEARADAARAREIVTEMRDRLGAAAPRLPPEALAPTVDDQRDPAAYTLIVALRTTSDRGFGDGSGDDTTSLALLGRLGEDLADRLRGVDGTELVRLFGAPEEELTVVVDPDRLAALDLAPLDVARALVAADAKAPAGVARGEADVAFEVRGALDGAERVAAVPLRVDGGATVRVGDVGSVRRDVRRPLESLALVDGRPAVLVAARMESGRIDRWARDAEAVLDGFRRDVGAQAAGGARDEARVDSRHQVGGGVVVDSLFEQERYTSARLRELAGNFAAGVAVVLLVVFALMGWRLALVVAAALPLTVAVVLFGLLLLGEALHQMSIFGMIIALGLLIDNAIVVADEVARRRRAGAEPAVAVAGAVRHLAAPLLASTTTTVLAFTPILLLPGSAGDFVGTIGLSVILALVASYVLSITVVAGLAGRLAVPPEAGTPPVGDEDPNRGEGRIAEAWRGGLKALLRRPIVAASLALALPIVGFVAATTLGSAFFPAVDRDQLEVRVWLPESTALVETRRLTARAETTMRSMPGVERVDWMIGSSVPSVFYNLVADQDGASHYAQAVVTTRSNQATLDLLAPLQAALDEALPEAQAVVRQLAQGPPVGADVELRLVGPRLETLRELGERVRLEVQSHPDVLHARSGLARGTPKLWLAADEEEARRAGLGLRDVAAQLAAQLDGARGGTVLEDLEQMPVRVRVGGEREDLAAIATLPLVAGAAGRGDLPLEALGALELTPQLGAVTRLDGERVQTISAYVRRGALPIDVTREIVDRLEGEAALSLPAGYRLEIGGAAEEDAEARGDLALYAPLLVVLTVSILVLSFRSVPIALLLLGVAGLSIGPGLLGTRLLDLPISFNTILGTLGLVGLAFNNSIVVLAALRADPASRRGEIEAVASTVVEASRHIVATTLTTIGGFLPLLLFVGGEFWPSLAIVMAAGVGGSAILALLFVPVVHVAILAKLERERVRGSKLAPASAAPIVLLLAGCATVGPDHVTPSVEIGSSFASKASASESFASESLAADLDHDWWRAFDDPLLDEWIARASVENLDLAVAEARVREAHALRRAAASGSRPRVGAGAGARAFELSENGAGAVPPLAEAGLAELDGTIVDAGLDAAWEIDLFGRVRREVEAADARVGAAVETRRGVLVALLAEVAREVVELRGAAGEIAALERVVAAQERTVEQTRVKVEVGLAAPLELEQALAQSATTRARLVGPRIALRSSAHRLAVLGGVAPSRAVASLVGVEPRSAPVDIVPAGLPAELLRRRPDVRAAERRLEAASAEIGVAIGRRFPRLVLGGGAGLESTGFGELFRLASGTWTLGAVVDWPIFEGGRLRAGVDAARARADAAEADYRSAVLRALEDVETALVAYGESYTARRELRLAVDAARRAARDARALHEDGLADFLVRLDAERRAAESEEALARAETAVGTALVGVYEALGGGWEVFEDSRATG